MDVKDLSILNRDELEALFVQLAKEVEQLHLDKNNLKVELGAFKVLTSELEEQVTMLDTAKKQVDRGLDMQIKHIKWLENALKEKDEYITTLSKVIFDQGYTPESVEMLKSLHSKQINSLNETIKSLRNALGYDQEGTDTKS